VGGVVGVVWFGGSGPPPPHPNPPTPNPQSPIPDLSFLKIFI